MDFALIKTGEKNTFTDGTTIFCLPSHYPVASEHPLALVEWFTPFRKPDPTTGYYHISRSNRRRSGLDGPYSEVITVDRFVRNAMLIP
ncbi:hypothetical protein BD779DRAFT_1429072, partial [Infundibulicybe gibba]